VVAANGQGIALWQRETAERVAGAAAQAFPVALRQAGVNIP